MVLCVCSTCKNHCRSLCAAPDFDKVTDSLLALIDQNELMRELFQDAVVAAIAKRVQEDVAEAFKTPGVLTLNGLEELKGNV